MPSRANYIRFPGNPNPPQRRATSATIIVLPVIRIESYGEVTPKRRRKRGRLPKLIASNEGVA